MHVLFVRSDDEIDSLRNLIRKEIEIAESWLGNADLILLN